jgi:hypothetical protein
MENKKLEYWKGWDQETKEVHEKLAKKSSDFSGFSKRHIKKLKKKEDYYDQLHNIYEYVDDLLRNGDPNAQGIRSLAERIQKMIKL